MQIRQPEQKRLYQQIADQIRQLIGTEKYAVGARLPGERDLAVRLEVSRPSLREALIALELEGTVEIRIGSGVYVIANPTEPNGMATALGESPSDLMQARMMIEGQVALLAAGQIGQESLEALETTLKEMEDDILAGRNPVDHDRKFHLAIAENCGNVVLERIVANLFDGRHTPIAEKLQLHYGTPETWRMALTEHHVILSALRRRDALLAQAGMIAHLDASRRRWIES